MKRLFRSVENLPLARKAEQVLDRLHIALLMLMITCGVALVCLVIVSIYFLVQLFQS